MQWRISSSWSVISYLTFQLYWNKLVHVSRLWSTHTSIVKLHLYRTYESGKVSCALLRINLVSTCHVLLALPCHMHHSIFAYLIVSYRFQHSIIFEYYVPTCFLVFILHTLCDCIFSQIQWNKKEGYSCLRSCKVVKAGGTFKQCMRNSHRLWMQSATSPKLLTTRATDNRESAIISSF